ncbi:MAG: thioredoxin fold domain-containing protein [Bacteroidota bacterium]
MKFILTTTICLMAFFAVAQEKGINFQNNLTWAQVKEKAKKENKYIFVDCYTTWCVPCKVMAKEVFPQPEVADFFNEKFVSIALQFDETKLDNADIKRWRAEVKRFDKEYKINAYPTYLFFSPDGAVVHSVIGGSDSKAFLIKAKQALDPTTQLINLRKQYERGDRSTAFLHTFANALLQGWDSQANDVINQYLATQTDLLTKENAWFVSMATSKSTDPGFKVLTGNSEEFDKLTGAGLSSDLIGRIVFDEVVLPIVRINGVKENHGGVYVYKGEIVKNVNWDEVYAKVKEKYPAYADEILLKSKVTYYRGLNNWPKYTEEAATYVKQYSNNSNQIMTYANDIMLFADDKACLTQAADWSKKLIDSSDGAKNSWYITVYASLLYKLGNKDKGLTVVKEAIARLGDKAYGLKEVQEKMEKGGEL